MRLDAGRRRLLSKFCSRRLSAPHFFHKHAFTPLHFGMQVRESRTNADGAGSFCTSQSSHAGHSLQAMSSQPEELLIEVLLAEPFQRPLAH